VDDADDSDDADDGGRRLDLVRGTERSLAALAPKALAFLDGPAGWDMHPRAFALLVLAALALPAAAQPSSSLLVAVAQGDAATGQALVLVPAPLRFIDGDGNGRATTDEPAYWDLDDSNSVSVGDLRLRAFRTHPAGVSVAVTDNDAGRILTGGGAWFGSASGAWYADLDSSQSVTTGDVRMAGATEVAAGASELGRPLLFPAGAATPGRAAIADTDHDTRWDHGEAAYLDLDNANAPSLPTVSVGDLRLAYMAAPSGGSSSGSAAGGAVEPDDEGAQSGQGGAGGSGGSSWGTPETVLLILGLVNLVGLAFVYTRLRDGGAPRNPFK
jgi:hypothetical protein